MDYQKLTKPYIKLLIKELDHLVAIPSFKDKKTMSKTYPYGKSIDDVLKAFAKFGKANKFKTELTNRYVELSVGNKGPIVEVFAHLDVVPMASNIYQMKKVGNKLMGRGVADDKGPLLAATYAVIALRNNNLIQNAQVKIFAGGDEECGESCIRNYIKTHPSPKFGFTPDSKFPLVYGEKGIGNITLTKNIKFKNIISIEGGNAANTVISECTFKVNNIKEIKNKIKASHKIKGNEITFIGVAAHGSRPELGKNAFLIGLKELGKINHDQTMTRLADSFLDYSGKKLGVYIKGKHLGPTVYNVGIVNYQNNVLTLKINYRYPENYKVNAMVKKLASNFDFKVVHQEASGFLLYDLKSPLVSALMKAYVSETKDKTKPVISGGGTYAKEVKNTVAFGAEPVNADYKMHETDEFIPIKDLENAMALYAHAIMVLIKQK
ncbi:MAG: Sapep family Mn(2+)-dependent dipeptidase [Bacilli bacterium]|nr:Sapep family Mn(2+)-dependent dipeptidase [Bacilli bacterium]